MKGLNTDLYKAHIMGMPSDTMNVVHCFVEQLPLDILERETWRENNPFSFRDGDIVWYTDGSK